MGNVASVAYANALGLSESEIKASSLAVENNGMIDFLVSTKKQRNYLQWCDEILLPDDPTKVIRTYTEHKNGIYGKVNFSLAGDSPSLSTHGEFIKELRASVISKPLLDHGLLYRGVDLSDMEIQEMERLNCFFIPSFASTSVCRNMAYNKNSLMVIKTNYCTPNACSVTPDLSDYYSSEKEVLLACYSAFRLERVEKVNNQNIITMYLDDIATSTRSLTCETAICA